MGRPENSRAALELTRRSNKRRAARSVIGAWRAASAGARAILGQQQVDDFGRRLGAQFRRDGDEGVGAAGEIGGEVEGGGGGQGDRAARPHSARRGRRALAAVCHLAAADWDPELSWRSAAGAGPSASGSRGRGRTPKARGFRRRRPGRPGRGRTPERRLCLRRRPDRPPVHKPSGGTRGYSGPVEPGRAAPPRQRSGLASRLGGRLASVAPEARAASPQG